MPATTTNATEAKTKVEVKPPKGYETLFDAVPRRATGGTVAGAFRPVKQPIIVKCEHGTEAKAEDRSEAHKMVTDPGTFCAECASQRGKREQSTIAELEARLAALKSAQ